MKRPQLLANAALDIIDAIVGGFKKNDSEMKKAGEESVNRLISAITGMLPDLADVGRNIVANIASGFSEKWDAFASGVSNAVSALGGLINGDLTLSETWDSIKSGFTSDSNSAGGGSTSGVGAGRTINVYQTINGTNMTAAQAYREAKTQQLAAQWMAGGF